MFLQALEIIKSAHKLVIQSTSFLSTFKSLDNLLIFSCFSDDYIMIQSIHLTPIKRDTNRLEGTGQNCGLVSRNRPVSTGFYKGTLVSFLVLDVKKVRFVEVYLPPLPA